MKTLPSWSCTKLEHLLPGAAPVELSCRARAVRSRSIRCVQCLELGQGQKPSAGAEIKHLGTKGAESVTGGEDTALGG